jgi:predicted ATPase
LSVYDKFPAVKQLGDLIENWHISDFHIIKARGEAEYGISEHLSSQGENLAQVAHNIHQNYPILFDEILQTLSKRVPGILNVESIVTEYGKVLLKFHDGSFKDPFLSDFISDGTIKMFAYLILLYDPKPHPLLCVEEPENQLYPKLLHELAEEFRAYSRRGQQVVASTHSPDFLNAVNLEEVYWLFKKDGYTKVKRASEDEQVSYYMQQGDKMGYLWREGFFEGIDPT